MNECFNGETNCMRCGAELFSKEDFQTGICPDCWTIADEQDGVPEAGAVRAEEEIDWSERADIKQEMEAARMEVM